MKFQLIKKDEIPQYQEPNIAISKKSCSVIMLFFKLKESCEYCDFYRENLSYNRCNEDGHCEKSANGLFKKCPLYTILNKRRGSE